MTEIWSKPLVSGITLFSTERVKEFQGIMELETAGGCYPPLCLRKQRKLRAKLREGIFWAWNRDLWGGSKCCSGDAGVSEPIEGYSRPLKEVAPSAETLLSNWFFKWWENCKTDSATAKGVNWHCCCEGRLLQVRSQGQEIGSRQEEGVHSSSSTESLSTPLCWQNF